MYNHLSVSETEHGSGVGRTDDEEHGLCNESESMPGEVRWFGTHKSDVVPVTGQFKFLGQTLQPCKTYRTRSTPLSPHNWDHPLTDIPYNSG